MIKKIHLDVEKHDGLLHAACGVADLTWEEGENTIVGKTRFMAAAESLRCKNCTAIMQGRSYLERF